MRQKTKIILAHEIVEEDVSNRRIAKLLGVSRRTIIHGSQGIDTDGSLETFLGSVPPASGHSYIILPHIEKAAALLICSQGMWQHLCLCNPLENNIPDQKILARILFIYLKLIIIVFDSKNTCCIPELA